MATNGAPEQSDAALQGGLPAGGWFTKSGKLLIIGVVALLLVVVAVGCNGSYGDDSGSSQSTASRSEWWADDCANQLIPIAGRYWGPHEREQREAEIVELCGCQYDYLTEYWRPDPPLVSSLRSHPFIYGISDYALENAFYNEFGYVPEDDELEEFRQQLLAEQRTFEEYVDISFHANSYCNGYR